MQIHNGQDYKYKDPYKSDSTYYTEAAHARGSFRCDRGALVTYKLEILGTWTTANTNGKEKKG